MNDKNLRGYTYQADPPRAGRLSLDLSWDDAEILVRLVGLANTGNLHKQSPALARIVEHMVEEVGRNTLDEARRYTARYSGGQVYIADKQNPPF